MDAIRPLPQGSLRASLDYEPRPLEFGTSGRRGDVIHLTQLEVYLNALAELEYLQSLPAAEGGIVRGDAFYFAHDLRPSSTRYVPEQGGRGEIAQAIVRALEDAGMQPVNLGAIPTPALTAYALAQGKGSVMITGSHIPFHRNGYKTNTACGELLKKDELPIRGYADRVRQRLYAQPCAESQFNRQGLFRQGSQPLPPARTEARAAYLRRYTEFFAGRNLRGYRLLVYQHSAVGRDLLVEVLRQFAAEVIPAGRSEAFVPIDTENIEAAQLETIQALVAEAESRHGPLDAVVSTDGDSDRPLILALEPAAQAGAPSRVRFLEGDRVGMVVAEFLEADAVVVPISCSDAVDRGILQNRVEPKTRIGSPHVIAGMDKARLKGRRAICGWEANGGFLTGSDWVRPGRCLPALPTRDALLPILGVLFAANQSGLTLPELFARLPQRFSRAGLLRGFPRSASLRILEALAPSDPAINEVRFEPDRVTLSDEDGQAILLTEAALSEVGQRRQALARFFPPRLGFGAVTRLNYLDGVRVYFQNGDVAHVRPSGNADELRLYAVADRPDRADAIVALGLADPDGILRQMEAAVRPEP